MAGEYADVFSRPLILGSAVVGATQAVTQTLAAQIDREDGGRGRIVGTVKEKNTPANTPLRRRVVLQNNRDKRTIRETWSDAVTGVYEFNEIALGRTYDVVSYDHIGMYRGVVADNLTPEVMP